jgi:hypothetical protein
MHVMLGPGLNVARVPVNGRNFEYMGEDPLLASRMAASEIKGIQSEGVVACAKHWIDNNQEGPHHNGRLDTSSSVGERANYELCAPRAVSPACTPARRAVIDRGGTQSMVLWHKCELSRACNLAGTTRHLRLRSLRGRGASCAATT